MKSVKKAFIVFVICSFIFSGNGVYAEKQIRFPDVPSTAWYIEDLQYILQDTRNIFSGYPDGTFRPSDTLTVDMFIKLIVTVMGHDVKNGTDYWASTYIEKAIEEGYVVPSEDYMFSMKTPDDPYAGYRKPISRGDMAMVTGRALDKITDAGEYRDPLAVSSLIKDYSSIQNYKKWNVVKCYDLGILTGFPDGEFKPDNLLSRAEAIAVIRRLIDPSARKKAELPVVAVPSPTPIPVESLNRPEKKDLGNGVVEVEGVRFDPKTDIVNKSNGAMGILKAEEFVHVVLQYLKFYEHEGKARVRGYIPELPEGYEWEIAIAYEPVEQDDRGYYGGTYFTKGGLAPEQTLPRPGNSFDKPLYMSKENIKSLFLTVEILTHEKSSGGNFYISLTLERYSRYDSVGGHSFVDKLDIRGFIEW